MLNNTKRTLLAIAGALMLFFMVGCDATKDTGDHLEDAGDSISDAAEDAADSVSDAAKDAKDETKDALN